MKSSKSPLKGASKKEVAGLLNHIDQAIEEKLAMLEGVRVGSKSPLRSGTKPSTSASKVRFIYSERQEVVPS